MLLYEIKWLCAFIKYVVQTFITNPQSVSEFVLTLFESIWKVLNAKKTWMRKRWKISGNIAIYIVYLANRAMRVSFSYFPKPTLDHGGLPFHIIQNFCVCFNIQFKPCATSKI